VIPRTTSAAVCPISQTWKQYDYSMKRRVEDLELLLDHLGVIEKRNASAARLGGG